MEMRMVLCWVLRHFRLSREPGFDYEEWEGKIQDWWVVHQEPLLVCVAEGMNEDGACTFIHELGAIRLLVWLARDLMV